MKQIMKQLSALSRPKQLLLGVEIVFALASLFTGMDCDMTCIVLNFALFVLTFGVVNKTKSNMIAYSIVVMYTAYIVYSMTPSTTETFLHNIFTSSSALEEEDEPLMNGDIMHPTATDYAAAYAGAGPSCEKQAEMHKPAAYYKQRGDWISQKKVSLPEGPPEVMDSCNANNRPIQVHKPCMDLEKRPLRLNPNPIDTEHNQPHYRSCHERPNKVQMAHDPASYSYSPA